MQYVCKGRQTNPVKLSDGKLFPPFDPKTVGNVVTKAIKCLVCDVSHVFAIPPAGLSFMISMENHQAN